MVLGRDRPGDRFLLYRLDRGWTAACAAPASRLGAPVLGPNGALGGGSTNLDAWTGQRGAGRAADLRVEPSVDLRRLHAPGPRAGVRAIRREEGARPHSDLRAGHAGRGARVHRSGGPAQREPHHAPGRGAHEAGAGVAGPVSGGHTVPIVPVAVDGGCQISRRGRIRSGAIHLALSRPLPTEGKTDRDRDAVLARVRAEIGEMLEAGRRGPAPESDPTAGPV